MGLKKAGLEELRVFTTDLAGQQFNLPLNLAFLKTYIMGSLINQMAARARPDEARRGGTDRVKAESLEKISAAIVGKRDLLEAFRSVVGEFSKVRQVSPDGARPLLVILGDLYVTSNSAFNREVEKVIEAAGGRALPSSFIDLSYFTYLNKMEKSLKDRNIQGLAEAKAMTAFVRFHDLQFRKAAAPVLDGVHPLMEGDLLKNVRGIGIPPELGGESAQNALKIFYYLRHLRPDGFVHLNPLYCCPGVVSRALLGWVEREFGVPVIHLFYDGIHNPNENLEPYIYYLKKKREGASSRAECLGANR
jgi:predicted nucleotide-binding protein (sugar kinase/HSP70/actin superfamily)